MKRCFFTLLEMLKTDLDVSSFMFEVDPGVGVAPNQDGEEQSGQRWGEEHDDQAKEARVANRDQRSVVRSKSEIPVLIRFWTF